MDIEDDRRVWGLKWKIVGGYIVSLRYIKGIWKLWLYFSILFLLVGFRV